jgi:hypothetical protein
MRTQTLVRAKGTDAMTSELRKQTRMQEENEIYGSASVRVRKTTRGQRLEVKLPPPAQNNGSGPVWLP